MVDAAGDAGQTSANRLDRECWWAESVNTVLANLDSSIDGLATDDIARRTKRFGRTAPSDVTTSDEWQILLRQFNSLPVWLLGVSSVISLATGGLVDAALIAGVITANTAIGFFTDRRAERILQAFIKHEQSQVMVRRDGVPTERLVEELVAGDIILVQPGNIIAADARIISSIDLQVDESMLTGESVPVMKSCTTLPRSVAVSDRTNMLYAGTVAMSGSAVAVVVATGGATEAGQIKALVASTNPTETPIQRQFNHLGTQLTLASMAASGLVFGFGFLRGVPLATLIRTTTALAVAAIPEGLPAVATSILATGLREMQRNNVLVRQIAAVETLGAVSVICFDKTGTLTQNKMTAVQVSTLTDKFRIRDGFFLLEENEVNPADHLALHALLLVAALCNDSDVKSADGSCNFVLNGSSTENAIMAAAIAGGIDVAEARRKNPLLERTPRSDTRRYMITVHEAADGNLFVAAKGNPIDLLALCNRARSSNGQIVALTEAEREGVLQANEAMTARGLRVLGFASVEHPADQASPPDHLVWLGMIGMADPVRPDINHVLRDFHNAGIHTVMVTGDQAGTASAIAHEVQLSPATPRVIEGSAFSQLDRQDIVETAGQYRRVLPGQSGAQIDHRAGSARKRSDGGDDRRRDQ